MPPLIGPPGGELVSEGHPQADAAEGLHVALAARNELTRQGLRAIVSSLGLVRSVQFCDNPWEFFVDTESKSIDILIIYTEETPLEQARHLATEAESNGVKTLLLLGRDEDRIIDVAATVPSNGFLLVNDLTTSSLADAVTRALNGDLPMPPSLASRLLATVRRRTLTPPPRQINLTPRERQTLRLLAVGLSNKQIARKLSISLHGAKRLVANVLAKLNCPNRTLAVTMALNSGLLPDLLHTTPQRTLIPRKDPATEPPPPHPVR